MQSLIFFFIALLIGYCVSVYVSKPIERDGYRRPNRLPTLKFKNIEILPCLRLHIRSKTYWFHHWSYLLVIVVAAFLIYDNLMHVTTAKAAAGASVGGIIQGLRYPDRFRFRYPRLKK